MIKVIHVVRSLATGGVERMLYNYYSHINRYDICFDFLVVGPEIGLLEPQFEKLGSQIFHMPETSSIVTEIKYLDMLFKETKYDILHTHIDMQSVLYLWSGKKHGIRNRIAHSHMAPRSCVGIKRKFINSIGSRMIIHYATKLCACGEEAGRSRYGKRRFTIIKNAIDVEKFKFNITIRNHIRRQYHIDENDIIIGHVGRLTEQKNQKYLIDVFEKYYDYNPNSFLMIIGEGEEEKELRRYIVQKKIEHVLFIGAVDNVNDYLQAFDIFLLPSFREGFPVAIVEAETSGLAVVASDTIDPTSDILGKCIFLPIDKEPESIVLWKNMIVSLLDRYGIAQRHDAEKIITENGFDIRKESNKLMRFYKFMVQKNDK